ncbi:MAG: hypothetical protein V2A78_03425 [bacterium]
MEVSAYFVYSIMVFGLASLMIIVIMTIAHFVRYFFVDRKVKFNWWLFNKCLIMFFVMLFFSICMIPELLKEHHVGGGFTACQSNLKNMGAALEMYHDDNHNMFPRSLQKLVPPEYLKQIPTCPSAGEDTYSPSYQVSIKADAYTVFCMGMNHKKSGIKEPNYPQYTSREGLITGR